MTSSPCLVTTRPLSDSLSFGISQTHSHLKPTLAESTQCFWFRRLFPTRTVLTFQQQRCLVYLIFGRTKGSFSGLLPGNSSSAVKHDRHFCGWLTSSAVALCVSSVLEVHHPPSSQPPAMDSETPPNNPLEAGRPRFKISQRNRLYGHAVPMKGWKRATRATKLI